MTEETEETTGTVWVRTTPDIDGTYRVSLEINEDDATFLDHDAANRWAEYVHFCVATAEYEAKVFRQLTARAGQAGAIQVIKDLRADRTKSPTRFMTPVSPTRLWIMPSVNIEGKPFLRLLYDGEPIGQWTLDDARSHASAVIEAIYAADFDESYRRLLVSVIGLDDETARRAVDGLSTYG